MACSGVNRTENGEPKSQLSLLSFAVKTTPGLTLKVNVQLYRIIVSSSSVVTVFSEAVSINSDCKAIFSVSKFPSCL